MSLRALIVLPLLLLVLLLVGCGGDSETTPSESPQPSTERSSDGDDASSDGQKFPEIVDAEVSAAGEGTYTFNVTVSSPYDSPNRYADAWRVLSPDGEELGVRELLHDHATEQPFTRSETIEVPEGVDEVTIEGRDLANGYGGKTFKAEIPS